MYKSGTKPETFFFIFDLIPGTKNGVLKYDVPEKFYMIK